MYKKSQIWMFFLIIFVISTCTTPETKRVESEWGDLDRVGAISCSPWPVKESELDIINMTATAGVNGGFVSTMRLRNGSQLPVFVETKGSDRVTPEQMKSFPVGRDAHVVALAEWNKEPIAFVIQNKNERAWLEIRGIRDNRMVARMATPLPDEVVSGRIVSASKGWWLQLSHSDAESSFVYVDFEKGSNWNFVASTYQSHTRFATVAGSMSDRSSYAVEQVKGADENNTQFAVTILDPSGKFNELGKLAISTKGGVESWSAAVLGGRVVIGVVRGDSMIGQASLIVEAIGFSGGNAALAWKHEFPFPDVHLGEPVFLSNGSKAVLGLIRWIDAEGSLSRIKVDASGAEMLSDVGVFAKGTVLVAGYLNNKDRGLGAFRYRDNDLWKYKLCRLSL